MWGFKRGDAPRYSSVTRDGYIGIGPGSGSHLPDGFTLNTFDLAAWDGAPGRGPLADRAADAVRGRRWRGWWWLYWRFYDTRIPMAALDEALGADAAKARRWLRAIEAAGLAPPRQRHARAHRRGRVLAAPGAEPLRALLREHAVDRGRREPWPPAVAAERPPADRRSSSSRPLQTDDEDEEAGMRRTPEHVRDDGRDGRGGRDPAVTAAAAGGDPAPETRSPGRAAVAGRLAPPAGTSLAARPVRTSPTAP